MAGGLGPVEAVAFSEKPRPADDSYMPVFTAARRWRDPSPRFCAADLCHHTISRAMCAPRWWGRI